MRNTYSLIISSLSALVLFSGCAGSGTSNPNGEISKVKYYLLDPYEKGLTQSIDQMVNFEPKYHLHGAISQAEREDRFGHYYSIFWSVADASAPVTIKFEYRQANKPSEVGAIEVDVEQVKRNNKTELKVTGEDYFVGGRVLAWQASVMRGGQVVASTRSFLWGEQ